MEIIDEKHCSGELINVADSLEYFGYEPKELLREAENCRLELYVALEPFKAKLIAINKPVNLLPEPGVRKAELSICGREYASLLPSYAGMILSFQKVKVNFFPANIPNDEGYIYHWKLEEPQKVDISRIYVYSEHVIKKEPVNSNFSLPDTEISNSKLGPIGEKIIECLKAEGYDPLKLPTYKNGFRGVKADISDKLNIQTFDKHWEKLLKNKHIRYESK